jgi:hypothetical protein
MSALIRLLLALGIQLVGELLYACQERLVGFSFPVEFIFKVLGLICAFQRGTQELVPPLGMLVHFL